MPELGESVTEGTVTRWLKQVGDSVEVDEPLLEVSTDKVDTEIPSPVAGTLLSITADEDETVEVGAELAVIGDADEAGGSADDEQEEPEEKAPAQEAPKEEAPEEEAPSRRLRSKRPRSRRPPIRRPRPSRSRPSPPTTAPGEDGESRAPYVTPLVRKLASENGVDLSTVSGSGVGGRIRKQDVLAAAEKAASRKQEKEKEAAPAAAQREPARPSRRRPAGRSPPRPRARPNRAAR